MMINEYLQKLNCVLHYCEAYMSTIYNIYSYIYIYNIHEYYIATNYSLLEVLLLCVILYFSCPGGCKPSLFLFH